nr:MAG TPA: hypothetical protein [Caudoviricetes sp.]
MTTQHCRRAAQEDDSFASVDFPVGDRISRFEPQT